MSVDTGTHFPGFRRLDTSVLVADSGCLLTNPQDDLHVCEHDAPATRDGLETTR
jgi:hypothetical protein